MTTTTTLDPLATESLATQTGGPEDFDNAWFGSHAWTDYKHTRRVLGMVLKVNTKDRRGTFLGRLMAVSAAPDNAEITATFEKPGGAVEVVRLGELLNLCPPLSGKSLERARTGSGSGRAGVGPGRRRGKPVLKGGLSPANIANALAALGRVVPVRPVQPSDYDLDDDLDAALVDDEDAMDALDASIAASAPEEEEPDDTEEEGRGTLPEGDPFDDDVYVDPAEMEDFTHLPEVVVEDEEPEAPTPITKARGKRKQK